MILAKLLKDNRDKKYYKVLGYKTFESYIASPELSFDRSIIYRLIQVYETFVLKYRVAPARLLQADYSKLAEIIPVITKENYEEWVSKSISLSRSDLREELREYRSEPITPITGGHHADLRQGDFRKVLADLKNNSVDLILTDPPYPKEYLPLWQDLSAFAYSVLKPGGFLISYSGQTYLPQVIESLGKHLKYYWLGMLYHKGVTGQRFDVNMFNRAKPILFFYKEPLKKQGRWIEDVLISEEPDKDKHEWGQSVEPFTELIEAFSEPGQVVCDPFVGGGATVEASLLKGREFIGSEIDKKVFDLVRSRLDS